MEARKLLYAGLVLTPAIALAGIGIHSRTYVDPFEWTSTAFDQRRVSAYIDVVRDTRNSISFVSTADRGELRRLAHRWIEGERKGKLKPLLPVAYDDMIITGAKSEILNSMVMLNRGLVHAADEQAAAGEFPSAIRDLLLSIQTAEVLKYSNFLIAYRCSMLQHSAVNRLQRWLPMATEDERKLIHDSLAPICGGTERLGTIAGHVRKIYIAALEKHDDSQAASSAADRMIPPRSFFEQPALAKSRPKAADRRDTSAPSLMLADLNAEAARSRETEKYLEAKIDRILASK